jgi:hypothetical protein
MRVWFLRLAVTLAVAAPITCGDPEPDADAPERYCPGAPGCEDEGDAPLRVGAAAVTITPTIDARTETLTVDVDGDAEYEPRDGDQFEDKNGNGRFDGEWIAGYGNARAARGVHDEQWARAIVLDRGDTRIALVSLDLVGFFRDDIELVRQAVAGEGIDFVLVASTHTHQARDSVGIWGVTEDETGVSPAYQAFVRDRTAAAIREAAGRLRESAVRYGQLRSRDLPGGMLAYHGDSRDPQIIDDTLRLLHFVATDDGATIATLVNWASHPEYLGDENDLLSSDFVHWLREGIESGVAGPEGARREGVGGICAFFQGALGSQIGPGPVRARDWDGSTHRGRTLEAARIVGQQLAWHTLGVLASDALDRDERAAIGFGSQSFDVDIQNRAYHTALLKKLFDRGTYDWDPDRPLLPNMNEPDVRTEVGYVDVGRAQIIAVPGELDPALFVGGYDGSFTPVGVPIVDTSTARKNPPDLSLAPAPPYLKDLARPDAEHVFLFGLANDFLGYFVPPFDYELHPRNPYFDEAEGDHYEETNSVGPDGWPSIHKRFEALLGWRARRTRNP